MSEIVSYSTAKNIMGRNFIGTEEIKNLQTICLEIPDVIPPIPFSGEVLEQKKDDYILLLGVSRFCDGRSVTIRNLKNIFGGDPEVKEPCFYNQDWYDKESFIDVPMKNEWFLIRKTVYEDSRAKQSSELETKYSFPSAIKCTYAFFITWMVLDIKLWIHDFVWCCDMDHNGDRVYVGKYQDVDGVNKNGFSIHRHLSLRPCYGCID